MYKRQVSYAFRPGGNHRLSVGVNAKLVYRNVGKFANGFGFGFDLGMLYNSETGWKYGAMLRDATTTVNFWTVNQKELSAVVNGEEFNPAPKDRMELTMPKLNLGMSRNFEINRDLEPVSYTHLDVYKRQAYGRCTSGRNWIHHVDFYSPAFIQRSSGNSG